MDNHFNSENHCITIESNVWHQFEIYLEPLSCKNIFWSLLETDGLKIDFEIGISILGFRLCQQQVSSPPLHCNVKCFDCNRWKSQTMYISNYCQLVFLKFFNFKVHLFMIVLLCFISWILLNVECLDVLKN